MRDVRCWCTYVFPPVTAVFLQSEHGAAVSIVQGKKYWANQQEQGAVEEERKRQGEGRGRRKEEGKKKRKR